MAQIKNWITSARRIAIYNRDGWCCVWCGSSVSRGSFGVQGASLATLDHVVPQSVYPLLCGTREGMNASDNLVTACHECNSKRRDMRFDSFAAQIAASRGETVEAVCARIRTAAQLIPGERRASKEPR